MLRNYLKVGLRNLRRTTFFSLINITGLAIGMAGTLMILMYVANELSYENFHKNRKQIYRLSVEFGEKGNTMKFAGAMPALAPAAIEEFPEVLNAVRFYRDEHAVIQNQNQKFSEPNVFFADSSVFDVFTFPLVEGRAETSLSEPFSVVLTISEAAKFFGHVNPIGKTLLYNNEIPLKITGIMQDIPANTHLNCEYLISFSSLQSLGKLREQPWKVFGDIYTYLYLGKDTNISQITQKIFSLLKRNTDEKFASIIKFDLLNLSDIHMKSDAIVDLAPRGNMSFIYIFTSVAFLILLIACFNFVNLSTARSLKRSKEVSMRKVLGARRFQLIKQFMGESLIMTILAVILAFVLFELFYPLLNSFLENSLSSGQQSYQYLYFLIPFIVFVVGVLAGFYPALFLSRHQPVHALTDWPPPARKFNFRRISVVIQFSMALILIIGTLVIFKQLHFMKNSELGFEKQNVVLLNFQPKDPDYKGKYSVLLNQFHQYPQVQSISGAYTIPGRVSKETKTIRMKTDIEIHDYTIQAISVDHGYVDSMGMEILRGRDFDKDISSDETQAILINEAAVNQFGLNKPVGQKFQVPGRGGVKEMVVIGVVKNFHIYSFKQKIEPLMLYINPEYFYTIAVKISPQNTENTLALLENTWEDIFPASRFNYTFLEDSYASLYASEEKIFQLLTLFAGLAIFVACLGLFGLASYMAEQRHKEIGIRKVLGADVSSILALLSKDFTKSVLIANLIAWPAAYFIMHKWLQNYAYRIDLNIGIFILAGFAVLIFALLTVSFQAVKAALTDPVESIRYE